MNLEHVLGDIQTDRGNLHVDGSPDVIRLQRTTLWHLEAGSGPSTTSNPSKTLGGAPLDDPRLGIVKYFTSLRCRRV